MLCCYFPRRNNYWRDNYYITDFFYFSWTRLWHGLQILFLEGLLNSQCWSYSTRYISAPSIKEKKMHEIQRISNCNAKCVFVLRSTPPPWENYFFISVYYIMIILGTKAFCMSHEEKRGFGFGTRDTYTIQILEKFRWIPLGCERVCVRRGGGGGGARDRIPIFKVHKIDPGVTFSLYDIGLYRSFLPLPSTVNIWHPANFVLRLNISLYEKCFQKWMNKTNTKKTFLRSVYMHDYI